MLCEYGCGREATFTIKSGKHICSKSANSCPINISRNIASQKASSRCLIENSAKSRYDANSKKVDEGICANCGKETKFINSNVGYSKLCSKKCCSQYVWENYREKISNAIRKSQNTPEAKIRFQKIGWWNNPKHRENASKRISEINKKNWQNEEYKNKMLEIMKENYLSLRAYGKINKTEQRLLSMLLLIDGNFKFSGDGSKTVCFKWPDFINEKKKLIIEYYSNYWHKDETEKQTEDRINLFKSAGYETLIVREKDLKNEEKLFYKLKSFICPE